MRTKLVVGNWKMNCGIEETKILLESILKNYNGANLNNLLQVCVCPSFTSLSTAFKILESNTIALGAQDVSINDNGAFTGEVSIAMLKELDCQFVIVGHSERRMYFKESDELINKKVKKILENNLTPIICVGETLEQKENNQTKEVIKKQIHGVTNNLSNEDLLKIVIAYEPVWAIGTGKNATPDQAEEVHLFIRKLLTLKSTINVSESISIIYGGSVKPENSKQLVAMENIDGFLVGGASLKSNLFLEIIHSF
ncbi:MAG: triose-phosphate isomerase [Bacteroidetes bacterium]|nr:triose-phosphate isomerase [Bacteroidota bacterium]